MERRTFYGYYKRQIKTKVHKIRAPVRSGDYSPHVGVLWIFKYQYM